MGLLINALQVLPLGTANAVWIGIGAVGALTIEIVVLGESSDPVQSTFAGITILGIIGLKLSA